MEKLDWKLIGKGFIRLNIGETTHNPGPSTNRKYRLVIIDATQNSDMFCTRIRVEIRCF